MRVWGSLEGGVYGLAWDAREIRTIGCIGVFWGELAYRGSA